MMMMMMMQIKSRWDKVSDLHTGHVLCVFIHGRTQSGWNRWLHGLPSHHKIKHKGGDDDIIKESKYASA